MARKKTIKNQTRLSFVVSQEQAKEVEKRAIQQSKQEGRLVSISEVLRDLVSVAIPVPKNQMELF